MLPVSCPTVCIIIAPPPRLINREILRISLAQGDALNTKLPVVRIFCLTWPVLALAFQALKSKKKKKKVRMLSNLANYLLGGNISSAQDAREGSNNESPESLPVMARLSQVEVEGDDWILIDPAGTSGRGYPSQRSPPRNSKNRPPTLSSLTAFHVGEV